MTLVPLVLAFVALIVGLLGAGMSAAAIWQKHRSDKREALWQRSQLAVRMSQSSRPTERELGTNMIDTLLMQDELSRNDAALLRLALRFAMVEGNVRGAGSDELAAIRSARHDDLARARSRPGHGPEGGSDD